MLFNLLSIFLNFIVLWQGVVVVFNQRGLLEILVIFFFKYSFYSFFSYETPIVTQVFQFLLQSSVSSLLFFLSFFRGLWESSEIWSSFTNVLFISILPLNTPMSYFTQFSYPICQPNLLTIFACFWFRIFNIFSHLSEGICYLF